MSTHSNTEAIRRLAALVRELAARDEFKTLMHYSHLIAELQELHDALNNETYGTPAHYRANAEATRVYRAARVYASDHKLIPPNQVMADCGYHYNPKANAKC